MNRSLSLLVVAVSALAAACATNPPRTSSVYKPSFEFVPPTEAAPAETGITIALLAPKYAKPVDVAWEAIAEEFARNLGLDLEEMLTARGFTVLGPFRTYDEMVYADKKNSQLLLTTRLDVTGEVSDVKIAKDFKFKLLGPSGDVYKVETATVTFGGRVTLKVAEPFTQETLWAPSIELDKRSRSFEGELEYDVRPTTVGHEPQFNSAVNRTLEEIYAIMMKECWDRLVPEELSVLKNQSMEIREKAGYKIGG